MAKRSHPLRGMLIDTHAHLTYPEFVEDFDGMLERARQAGVTRVISIGTSVESSRQAVALAERHDSVFAAVGVHPDSALDAAGDFISELRTLAASPRVVAIGEAGLDYFRREPEQIAAEKDVQAAVFIQQLELAVELGLNIVIHERAAWAETLALLAPFSGRTRGVFHCFGRSLADAEKVLADGHLVSFTGIATFKNAAIVQDTAARLPTGSFMVETDCPYLAPVPLRGKRCEPAHTRYTAEHIARLRGETLERLAADTTATAESFFRF